MEWLTPNLNNCEKYLKYPYQKKKKQLKPPIKSRPEFLWLFIDKILKILEN